MSCPRLAFAIAPETGWQRPNMTAL
jgi:hypothetical protein